MSPPVGDAKMSVPRNASRESLWQRQRWQLDLRSLMHALYEEPSPAVRRLHFSLLLATLALGIFLHYGDLLPPLSAAADHSPIGLATRQSAERILFLLPIMYATLIFRTRAGLATLLLTAAVLLPRAAMSSETTDRALPETGGIIVVGLLLIFTMTEQRRQVEISRESKKRLAAIDEVSSVMGQSLSLSDCLQTILDNTKEVAAADAALLYLADEESQDLALVAHCGVEPPRVESLAKLRIGEDSHRKRATCGQAFLMQETSSESAAPGALRTRLIVPLWSKGRTIGALCVGTQRRRSFSRDEIRLLTAIGRQAGVAVENAHLYQQVHQSEKRYRDLFENAGVAVFVQAMDGTITAANAECARLMGYTRQELIGMNVSRLLAPTPEDEQAERATTLIHSDTLVRPVELPLIRKDGSKRIITLRTTVVTHEGDIWGFQRVAIDLTEQKRMRDNLNYFMRHILTAQESERQRIALELHDETAQSLLLIAQRLDKLTSKPGGQLLKEAAGEIKRQRTALVQVLTELRRLTQDLRPRILDDLGLVAALEWLVDDLPRQYGIECRVEVGGALPELSQEAQLLLFRIAQEALRNVGRHSGASEAIVSLHSSEDRLRMSVADNGRGFEPPEALGDLATIGQLGLLGMYERARLLCGTLEIHSEPGKGTTVVVELPATAVNSPPGAEETYRWPRVA